MSWVAHLPLSQVLVVGGFLGLLAFLLFRKCRSRIPAVEKLEREIERLQEAESDLRKSKPEEVNPLLKVSQRLSPPSVHLPVEEELDWQETLRKAVEFTRSFIEQYGGLMSSSKRSKMERGIRQAEEILAFPDEATGRRLIRLLETEVLSAGLATQLSFAKRAAVGAPPVLSRSITERAHVVRQAHDAGETVVAAEQAHHLGMLVAKALNNFEQ